MDEEVTAKKFYVTPEGFEVSAKANKLHGITQETLMTAGKPLGDVLQEFMNDVIEACRKGARVVAHQIEEILFWVILPGLLATPRKPSWHIAMP